MQLRAGATMLALLLALQLAEALALPPRSARTSVLAARAFGQVTMPQEPRPSCPQYFEYKGRFCTHPLASTLIRPSHASTAGDSMTMAAAAAQAAAAHAAALEMARQWHDLCSRPLPVRISEARGNEWQSIAPQRGQCPRETICQAVRDALGMNRVICRPAPQRSLELGQTAAGPPQLDAPAGGGTADHVDEPAQSPATQTSTTSHRQNGHGSKRPRISADMFTPGDIHQQAASAFAMAWNALPASPVPVPAPAATQANFGNGHADRPSIACGTSILGNGCNIDLTASAEELLAQLQRELARARAFARQRSRATGTAPINNGAGNDRPRKRPFEDPPAL